MCLPGLRFTALEAHSISRTRVLRNVCAVLAMQPFSRMSDVYRLSRAFCPAGALAGITLPRKVYIHFNAWSQILLQPQFD